MVKQTTRSWFTSGEIVRIRDMALSDRQVARIIGRTEEIVHRARVKAKLIPADSIPAERSAPGKSRANSNRGKWPPEKCGNGHEFTPENTRTAKPRDGYVRRYCLICQADYEERKSRDRARPTPIVDLPGEVWRPIPWFPALLT